MDKERPAAQVSGHGNFGSLDADPPAAMRYTECRLQAFASAVLLADLEYDTVDMAPTFDGSQARSDWHMCIHRRCCRLLACSVCAFGF